MPSNEDVSIKVVVDAQGAIKAFDALGNEIEDVQVEAKNTERGFSSFQATLVTLNQALELGKKAWTAFSGAAQMGADVLERGSQIDDVASAFNNLANQAGKTADVFLNEVVKATGETISDFDLMKKANEAMLAGIKPDAFIILNQAARQFAEEGGTDMRAELEQLSFALQTGSDRALKAKGIFIDNVSALEKYASAMGISAERATEAQKAEAQRLAILEALIPKAIQSNAITADAGDKVSALKVAWQNATDQLLREIAANDSVNQLLDETRALVKSIDLKGLAADFGNLAKAMADTFKPGGEMNRGLRVVGELSGKDFADGFKKWFMQTLKPSANQKDLYDLIFEPAIQRVGELDAKFAKLSNEVLNNTGRFKDFVGPLYEVGVETERASFNIEDLVRQINGISTATPRAKEELKALSNAALDSSGSFKDFVGPTLPDPAQNEEYRKEWDLAGRVAADLFRAAFDKSLTGADWKNVIGNVGGQIGETYFGPLGGAIGEALFTAIFTAFGGGDSKGTKAKKELDKAFAELFDANRLSVVINDQLVRINDLVFSGNTLFGGSVSAGDSAFSDFFRTLPEEAQRAFDGVGNAFLEMFDQFDEFGRNLGQVFANNIGGSLENLQQLIYATGKSAEEMQSAIVSAFEKGQISALEAQSALNGIAQVMQEGIPDGIGLIDQAFKNMQAAGTKGGRVTADALSDIGDEAKELGLKDLPAVAEALKQRMPEAAAEIDKVFEALKAVGITTVEGLAAATTEQLIPALARLESQDFPFAEAAEDMNALIDRVNELPKEIRTKYIIEVETTGDTEALSKIPGGTDIGDNAGISYGGQGKV